MYEINLEYVCRNQAFKPEQVVSADLVYPRGAVPNAQLIWVRIQLESGDRKFVTLALTDFYRYVKLPESSIGGWTDGHRGSDYTGLNARYEVDHSGGSESVSSELFDGTERIEEAVASELAAAPEGGQDA